MVAARKRKSQVKWNVSDTRYTNRQLYVRKSDDPLNITVRANGTVIVDATDLYRVVEHTGELDEATGLERLEIVSELETFKDALQTSQIRNQGKRGKCSTWVEILDYDEVYKRENGQLIDHVRPRKSGPKAKAMRAARKKLRIAKVS